MAHFRCERPRVRGTLTMRIYTMVQNEVDARARRERRQPAFAGQWQEALERTVVAPDPQKTMDEQPAAEEAAELALDEAGQADPVGAGGGRGEEGLQMLLDHPVQDRVGGGARSVGSHGAGPAASVPGGNAPLQHAKTSRHWAPRR